VTHYMHIVKAAAIAVVIFTFSMPVRADISSATDDPVNFRASKKTVGTQCIILNRSSPNFERELLSVPREACVIVIGSWIIKTDYLFKPIEIVSPKNDTWRVLWKDLNSPLDVSSQNWSFKFKTKGLRQIIASISYHF